MRCAALLALSLALVTQLQAVTIVGYDPDLHDRFDSGFPSGPIVQNSSVGYVGAGYDFSGVGWDAALPTRAVTMISDQYFVYSGHYAVGSQVSFRGADGSILTYTVDTGYSFAPTATEGIGDLRIGRLTTSVSPTIASYAILDLPDESLYSGLSLLVYGHGDGTGQLSAPWFSPRLGTNTSEGLLEVDLGGGVTRKGLVWDQDAATGEALLESGDSGSPTFAIWNGQLVLLGTHYGVDGTTSVDDLIALYADSMAAAGIPFSAVPEPHRASVLLMAFGALFLRRRR